MSYRKKIESEIVNHCNDVLMHIENDLIPIASDNESKVYWLKMRGDYSRYLAESLEDADAHHKAADTAHEAYKQASNIALNHLPAIHPTRLGLALNFSVFYYEILNSAERACLLGELTRLGLALNFSVFYYEILNSAERACLLGEFWTLFRSMVK